MVCGVSCSTAGGFVASWVLGAICSLKVLEVSSFEKLTFLSPSFSREFGRENFLLKMAVWEKIWEREWNFI
jgi:hypothetical protein